MREQIKKSDFKLVWSNINQIMIFLKSLKFILCFQTGKNHYYLIWNKCTFKNGYDKCLMHKCLFW